MKIWKWLKRDKRTKESLLTGEAVDILNIVKASKGDTSKIETEVLKHFGVDSIDKMTLKESRMLYKIPEVIKIISNPKDNNFSKEIRLILSRNGETFFFYINDIQSYHMTLISLRSYEAIKASFGSHLNENRESTIDIVASVYGKPAADLMGCSLEEGVLILRQAISSQMEFKQANGIASFFLNIRQKYLKGSLTIGKLSLKLYLMKISIASGIQALIPQWLKLWKIKRYQRSTK